MEINHLSKNSGEKKLSPQAGALYPYIYLLLALYLLPLALLAVSMLTSDLFQDESVMVGVAGSVLDSFVKTLRYVFGALLIPFVTAYSVRSPQAKVTAQTKILLLVLVFVCAVSAIIHGLVGNFEARISAYGAHIFDVFNTSCLVYTIQLASYIAMVIGVSARPSR